MDMHLYTDKYADIDTYRNRYCNQYNNYDFNANSDAYANKDNNVYVYGDLTEHAYFNRNKYHDDDADAYVYGHKNGYAYFYFYENRDVNLYLYTYSHTDANVYKYVYPYYYDYSVSYTDACKFSLFTYNRSI